MVAPPTNADLLARSLAAVWHPCTQMKRHERYPLLPIARGEGAWLYDFDGKRYLDAVSSWWVNLFGHCNPRINAALQDQLAKLEHVMLAGFTQQPVVELSERLSARTGGALGHCFYGSDGAAATEIALKMSFHYWRNCGRPDKTQFVSLRNSYHGETLGALAVTDVALFRDVYAPLLRQGAQVPAPDWRDAAPGESAHDYALRCAQALGDYLAEHHAHTAAFIVEPLVQGAAGMAMYHPVYLRRARDICDRHGVHLIADEIAVGFGRTGTFFACEQAPSPPPPSRREGGETITLTTTLGTTIRNGIAAPYPADIQRGIVPDFLCLSKGITGGYLPLSVVLTRDEIYQAFYHDEVARGFLHSHSYTGNALACRAALAVLDIFEQDDVIARNRVGAAQLNALLAPLRAHDKVRDFRNTGMIWAFEVDDPRPDFAQRCFQAALARGVLLRPIGNTVYLMPPYILSEEEMAFLAAQTLAVVGETTRS